MPRLHEPQKTEKNLADQLFPELQFNVAQFLKEPTGATRIYDINIGNINDLDEEMKVVSPVTGQIKLLRTGNDILVTSLLEANIKKQCSRCLTRFTRLVSIELEETFYPTVDVSTGSPLSQSAEADETNTINEQHILNLSEAVGQELFLEGDSLRSCRPDCLGLCPHCGQDRNVKPCQCQTNQIDQRWAGLLEKIQTKD